MELLVTGGAGYIGSVVAARLVADGHAVTVLDSLERGHRSAVPAGAAFVQADLRDAEAAARALEPGFDAVLHFAGFALVAESVTEPELYERNNVGGTRNLLDAMRAGAVDRLVFSSTCATYGEPDTVPIAEDSPERPVNPYGASKLEVDRMLGAECVEHGLGAISLRYFNVAGAQGPHGEDHEPETHIIPNVLAVALGRRPHVDVFGTDYPTQDGTAVRDYIHVEDLATAHLLALEALEPGRHEVLNLGSGTGFSVRQVVEAARRVTGHPIPAREAPRRAGDPPALVAASARIRERLGWEPEKPGLDEIVADAWAWHQAHPDGYPD